MWNKMNKYLLVVIIFISALGILGVAKEKGASFDEPLKSKDGQKSHTVLVELFTSEGCSSCPSADRVLEELANQQPIANTEIVVLSEHVDYWNRLGWEDPYSANEFTMRQYGYAQALEKNGVYTPQMVINGQYELVGSDKEKALALIGRSGQQEVSEIKLTAKENSNGAIGVHIDISKLPLMSNADASEINQVMLAITEDNLSSNVKRGENSGRKLNHTGVVRKLSVIGQVDNTRAYDSNIELSLSREWQRNNLKVIVFVQNRRTHQVLGVASAKI